jgi:abortive infection bacteriophage resistance protein
VKYAKPATTFEEQADLLLKRGMLSDRATLIARLAFVNYYRLSAYWWPFRKSGATPLEPLDEFVEGTEFATVWDHYVFDQRLRVLVMEAIERIEVATRTQLAYHHAHAWTLDAYATNPASLPRLVAGPATDPRSHAAFLDKLHLNLQQNSDKPFVRHFKAKYTSSAHLPVWMAVELMSLGNVTSMYQGCTDDVRDLVATNVAGVSNAIFGSWLLTLLNVRNICAHHGRLWNRKLAKIPAIPAYKARPEWYHPHFDSTKVYAALTICNYLLTIVTAGSATWGKRLVTLLGEHPRVQTADMGYPVRWLDSPLWANAK